MDSSEALVEQMLKHMGFSHVEYEPDGNVPPDFLADRRVAIEVRRLNQNHDSGNGKRGLEELTIPLWQHVEQLAKSFGQPSDRSWFLFFHFSRPVRPWKELEPQLKAALVAFQTDTNKTSGKVHSEAGFELEIIRASKLHPTYFLMGGCSDEQSGGWVVAEMLSNIDHCINEKSRKVAKVRGNYNEWWLVLVDHIGLGIDEHDKQQLLAHVKRPSDWDRIVVVSPRDPTNWLEF